MNRAPYDIQPDSNLLQFLQRLFTADFMPHGHCFYWRPDVLWLNVFSDLLIAFAYYSIPVILIYFVYKRKNVPFHFMFLMFGAFIFLCGTTHVVNIITTWYPAYRLEGFVKLLTGIVSVVTAFWLIPIMPKAISFPSMETLIEQLSTKTKDLKQVNKDLEHFNHIAMGREQRIIALKGEVNHLASQLGQPLPYHLV